MRSKGREEDQSEGRVVRIPGKHGHPGEKGEGFRAPFSHSKGEGMGMRVGFRRVLALGNKGRRETTLTPGHEPSPTLSLEKGEGFRDLSVQLAEELEMKGGSLRPMLAEMCEKER